MPRKKKEPEGVNLISVITDAMLDKKAMDPVVLNMKNLNSSVCDAFVICHGASRPQVEAIAEEVIGAVKKKTGQNPWHKEGFENAEWILIDFSDVVVHIFQDSKRPFYNLEQLWADAEITKIKVKN
jgi:ribosome-associated protein